VVVSDRIELSTFRFSVGFPGPQESTRVRLSTPGDVLGHLGVHSCPHVFRAVVSRALAVGLFVPKPSSGVARGRTSSHDECRRRPAREGWYLDALVLADATGPALGPGSRELSEREALSSGLATVLYLAVLNAHQAIAVP
jgi:hypothetical protein